MRLLFSIPIVTVEICLLPPFCALGSALSARPPTNGRFGRSLPILPPVAAFDLHLSPALLHSSPSLPLFIILFLFTFCSIQLLFILFFFFYSTLIIFILLNPHSIIFPQRKTTEIEREQQTQHNLRIRPVSVSHFVDILFIFTFFFIFIFFTSSLLLSSTAPLSTLHSLGPHSRRLQIQYPFPT